MSGLFRRLRRDRHAAGEPAAATEATAAGAPPATADASAHADAGAFTEGHAHEESTAALEPAEAPPEDLDAMVGLPPTTRRRGRLRRRLRHLRRVREVLMRDLGGFVFEIHRSGSDGAGGSVVEAKLRRLAAVDRELRELETLLDDRRPLVVREAGIGGACPECGELFGSEARYCWACGNAVAAGAGQVPRLLATYGDAEIEAGAQAEPAIEGSAADAEAPTATTEPATAEGPPAGGEEAAQPGRRAGDEWLPGEERRP